MSDEPRFGEIKRNTEKLERLWEDVKEILEQNGKTWNHDLIKKHEIHKSHSWTKRTVEKALGDIRNSLEEQEVIEVQKETGKSNKERKVWVKT